MKQKILFIHHGIGIGGASLSLINMILAIDKNKFDVSVLLIKKSRFEELLIKHQIKYSIAESLFYQKIYRYFVHSEVRVVPYYRIDILFSQLFSFVLSKYYFASRELNKIDFDVVHLNSSVLTDWLAPSKKKGPVLIHVREPIARGIFGLRFKLIQTEMNKYADKIIAISKDNSDRLLLREKTEIVYNFIDFQNIVHKKDTQTGKILYLGGDDIIKGFLNVVEALDFLDPDIKIVFCGNYGINYSNTSLLRELLKKIKGFTPIHRKLKHALTLIQNHPNAIFVGFVSNLSNLMCECEFLISPFDKPHFSRPIFEAFAFKRTVIGTNVKGMDEMILNGFDGLIVQRNNPQELAQAIKLLHSNFELREKMADNGYKKAQTMFDINNINQIERIYNSFKK